MRVTVLGCSGSYPGKGGACSGYLVDDGRTRLWLDAGSGTLANLQRHLDPGDVDAMVLSHEHPDHWSDLEGFYNVLQYVLEKQTFPVYAPPGLRGQTYEDMAPYVVWHEVGDADHVTIGTYSLTFSRTDHGPETLAVRVDTDGTSFGYTADTGPGWSLKALGEGLNLALCEATLPSEMEGKLKHLSAREAGEQAREAGAGRLVLTHLWPTLDPEQSRVEASEAFGADVEVAAVGRSYEL